MDPNESPDYWENAAANAVFSMYFHCEVQKMLDDSSLARSYRGLNGEVVKLSALPVSYNIISVDQAIDVLGKATASAEVFKLLRFIVPVMVRSWKPVTGGSRVKGSITSDHVLDTAKILVSHSDSLKTDSLTTESARSAAIRIEPDFMNKMQELVSPTDKNLTDEERFQQAFEAVHPGTKLGKYQEPQLVGKP